MMRRTKRGAEQSRREKNNDERDNETRIKLIGMSARSADRHCRGKGKINGKTAKGRRRGSSFLKKSSDGRTDFTHDATR